MSTVEHPAPAHVYGPPVAVEVMVRVTALAVREADGGYSVVVPELPGLVTGCHDADDIAATVADAASAWLPAMHERHRAAALADLTEPLESEPSPMNPVSVRWMCKVLESRGRTLDHISSSHHVDRPPPGSPLRPGARPRA